MITLHDFVRQQLSSVAPAKGNGHMGPVAGGNCGRQRTGGRCLPKLEEDL